MIKKFSKVTSIAFSMILMLILGVGNVDARVMTEKINGPDAISGKTTYTGVYKLSTDEYSSVQGPKTHIKMTAVGSLEMGTRAYANTRNYQIQIFEDDEYPNTDELVRTYTMTIRGRNLTKGYTIDRTEDNGNIDSAGDTTAELYLSAYLPELAGDTSYNSGNLFIFKFYIGEKMNGAQLWDDCVAYHVSYS